MKAVNLIPSDNRRAGFNSGLRLGPAPRTVFLLGVLAVAVGLMTLYVLTNNTISKRKSEIAALPGPDRPGARGAVEQPQPLRAVLADGPVTDRLGPPAGRVRRPFRLARRPRRPLQGRSQQHFAPDAQRQRRSSGHRQRRRRRWLGAPGGRSGPGDRADRLHQRAQPDVAQLMSRLRLIDGVASVVA